MTVVRKGLLQLGNSKLGEGIHAWSLAAVVTCPGRSATCESVCYSNGRGRYRFEQVKARMAWNLEQSMKEEFVDRMTTEIGRKGCQVIRVHASGDFWSKEYAEKWLEVMRRKPKPRYYFYTRSWRCPDILPVLEQMAQLRQCRAWFSIDRDTGIPDRIPSGVRLAYLQVAEDETPELLDLRFSVRRLRKLALPMACPNERGTAASCGDCTRCYR